jgi:hypothetical protein
MVYQAYQDRFVIGLSVLVLVRLLHHLKFYYRQILVDLALQAQLAVLLHLRLEFQACE